MTFNNIVSGVTVFIGSREDINHLSPETFNRRPEPPLLSVSVILAPFPELHNKLRTHFFNNNRKFVVRKVFQ